tara:strand:+ start:1376 stop:2053 length:678 start_codon:yes stop_codon:yes gene_type:complete
MTPLEKISSYFIHEKKAMEWLDSICSGNDWVTIESKNGGDKSYNCEHVQFEIRLQGESKRRYRIWGMVALGEEGLVKIQPLSVYGAVESSNGILEQDPWCSLCISPDIKSPHLPLGDQLCSMVLALHNDRVLAKSIPLLEMFLVHDYEEHQWILGYYSTGLSLNDDESEYYDSIPSEIRNLSHHLTCIEDELQCSAFSHEERQSLIDGEMRAASEEIHKKKHIEE